MKITVFICFLLVATLAKAESGSNCKQLYNTENYNKAYAVCAYAANLGDIVSRYYAGVMLVQGLGGPKNELQGVAYLEMAASAGNSDAQRDLGSAYQLGIARNVDMKKALYWYEKSANNKNVPAMLYIAGVYHSGNGVTKDLAKSYAYSLLAASYGSEAANKALVALEGMEGFTPAVKAEGIKLKNKLARAIQ